MAISIHSEHVAPAAGPQPSVAPPASPNRLTQIFAPSVKRKEVTFFASQLALMLDMAIPLSTALAAIKKELRNPALQRILELVCQDIEAGHQLSEALSRHPKVFDRTFTSMVNAGESGGFLKDILERIVEMEDKRRALLMQVRTALTYPVVLLLVGLVVVIFILAGVLPKFTAFFDGKTEILPITTRFFMGLSASLRAYGWLYGATLGGIVGGVWWLWPRPAVKRLRDLLLTRGPLISGLANKIYTCNLLRTLGHLMASQVPLLDALQITGPTVANHYYQRFVESIAVNVDQGGRFATPFSEASYIPETVKQMVAIGEEAGRLPKVMLRLADYYDTEISQELKKLTALIEPLALIVMGVVVGMIVSSIILPMFRLAHAIR